MSRETSEFNGCLPKVVSSWRLLLSTLSIGHQIHPTDNAVSTDSEFILIDSKIHIRVIHKYPGNTRISWLPQTIKNDPNINSKRNSLSEEYWFTKWNKPLKIVNCNCSFRRSLRHSIISTQPTFVRNEKNRGSLISGDVPCIKITNLETFVERLVQETFFEALHEYCVLQNKLDAGKVNLAYDTSEEDNQSITLRRKIKINSENENVAFARSLSDISLCKANLRNSITSIKSTCVHKKVQKKPMVILIHGIGTCADIWSLITNALVNREFEIVAPDLLGHGFSSAPNKPGYYSFSSLLLQLLSIFDHYMTDEKRKCILIGHSYGCSLVTALYSHRAPRVAQLILISGGGPTPLAPPVRRNEIPPFGCVYNLLHPLLFCGLKRSLFYSSRGKHFKPCNIENALPNHVLQNIANGQKWPEGDAAFHRKVMVPTLLVHGLQDTVVTLVQECEMERTIPRAFLELIPNAGHMSMVETPEHLIHMITCFLDMWF